MASEERYGMKFFLALSRTETSPLQKMSPRGLSFSARMRFIASPVPRRTAETLIPVFFSKL